MPVRDTITLGVLALVGAAGLALAQGRDPPFAPGRDPGGIAVAVFAAGVDYRDPPTAARLARDGEGDVIAWDFVDNDPRPFGETDPRLRQFLDWSPAARAIVARAAPGDPARGARLTAFAVRTPARIILTWDAAPGRPDWALFLEGMRRFPDRLFVLPCAGEPARWAEARSLPNLVLAGLPGMSCDVTVREAASAEAAASSAAAWAVEILAARASAGPADVKQDLVRRCAAGCAAGVSQPR